VIAEIQEYLMPLVSTSSILTCAHRAGIGAAGVNVVTFEQAEAVIEAAELEKLPVIIQVSERCLIFHGAHARPFLFAITELARTSTADVSVHLDHIEARAWLMVGLGTGVSSAMVDASRFSFTENVTLVSDAAGWCHDNGWHIEAELGAIGGKDGSHALGVRTHQRAAAEYVAATSVDSLAVAVGSVHAMRSADATLDFELIARLAAAVPVPLVLHGSSGVKFTDLRRAIKRGITKLNVGTLVATSYTDAIRRRLAESDSPDPRVYLTDARSSVSETTRGVLRAVALKEGAGTDVQ
jgi:fructose-bisphosphate aldolase class II